MIDAVSTTRFLTIEDSIDDYSSLDQYLMGMRAPGEVAESFFVKGTGIGRGNSPTPGISIFGTQQTITIDDIIAAEGPRSPAYPLAQSGVPRGVDPPSSGTGEPGPGDDRQDRPFPRVVGGANHALEGRGALSTSWCLAAFSRGIWAAFPAYPPCPAPLDHVVPDRFTWPMMLRGSISTSLFA